MEQKVSEWPNGWAHDLNAAGLKGRPSIAGMAMRIAMSAVRRRPPLNPRP